MMPTGYMIKSRAVIPSVTRELNTIASDYKFSRRGLLKYIDRLNDIKLSVLVYFRIEKLRRTVLNLNSTTHKRSVMSNQVRIALYKVEPEEAG